ncbi:MAG: hypothetical protein HQL17_04515 [Candidatus Omnitrophica bacterium]|nr:hypothetical protein [Candidatus Omnitrophota bacterium]
MKRILAFLIGMFAVLAALEAGLRVWSFIQYKNNAASAQVLVNKKEGGPYVILCLGNSYTAGAGASDGMSYPAQLQRMFRERMKDRDVVVINGGIFIQNTAELLSRLPSDIEQFKPDLILLQTGQPNLLNYRKYTDYLRRMNRDSTLWGRVNCSLMDLFAESRVCRLVLLVLDKGRDKEVRARQERLGHLHEERYVAAEKFMDSVSAMDFGGPRVIDLQKEDAALKVFLEAVKNNAGCPLNYVLVGRVYELKKQYREALNWFVRAVRVAPDLSEAAGGYEAMRCLRTVQKGQDEAVLNQEIDTFLRDLDKKNGWCAGSRVYLTLEDIRRWIESDLKQIIKIARGRGISIILQNYPVKITPVNKVIRKVAAELGVPYISHFLVFRERMSAGETWQDLFVPDGHCNDHGYAVMAEEVYNKIVAENFLKIPVR